MENELFSFVDAQKLIIKFEELLDFNKIKVSRDSDLESKFLSTFDILFKYEKKSQFNASRDAAFFRDFSALYDLALKIMMVKDHPDFKELIPHLVKLNECKIAQNQKSVIIDQDANKIIELYVAALCMKICEHVTLDNPIFSKGDNPDILATYCSKIWGFACKTIHTRNSRTIFENIIKAVDQIERSTATIGIPVINLKNVINHDSIWPKTSAYNSVKIPADKLFEDIESIRISLLNEIGKNDITQIFKNKKSLPGVMFIAHSTTLVFRNVNDKAPIATRLNMMNLLEIPEEGFNYDAINFLEKIYFHMKQANIN